MDMFKNYFLSVNKRVLLLIAGLVWGFAGFRVFSLGKDDVILNHGSLKISVFFSVVIFYIFFNFIFKKMSAKHTKRIISSKLEKQCLFSFFDIKGYIIMAFMITFGIVVRSSGIFNPIYVGIFYIGLGGALFLGGVLFLINFMRFKEIN